MRAVKFKGSVTPGGQIAVPPEVVQEIPVGQDVQIVVLWETPTEDEDWKTIGHEQFEAAYAPEDSIYEQLVDEPSTR